MWTKKDRNWTELNKTRMKMLFLYIPRTKNGSKRAEMIVKNHVNKPNEVRLTYDAISMKIETM